MNTNQTGTPNVQEKAQTSSTAKTSLSYNAVRLVRKPSRRALLHSAFLFCALIWMVTARPLFAATTVNCEVDGEEWTAAGSPYLVDCNVYVSFLRIQPGVEVRFLNDYVFEVGGVLEARGTGASRVRFTAADCAVGWQGILFNNSVPGSFLNYCTIECAQNSGVRITNSPAMGGAIPAFTNCVFIHNYSPDYGGAIDAWTRSGDLILDGCLIASNRCGYHGGGINAVLNNGGTLKMVQCTNFGNIANVGVTNGGGYVGGAVRITGHSILLNCDFVQNVSRGRVYGNSQDIKSYGGAIYSDTGNALMRNCRFQRNRVQTDHCCSFSASRAWGGAVYFEDGRLTMQNCIVDTNSCTSNNDSSGAGVFVGSGTADIINCTIVANNTQGIYRSGGTVDCLNSILFFNNSEAAQIAGTATASWCDIQGGFPGDGNKAVSPSLRGGTLELFITSPMVDMGSPDPVYNDSCFTPPMTLASKGTERNDMGAYGGPAACCWTAPCGPPVITSQPMNTVACVNSSAGFCVGAIGDQPLRYQWRFHGTNASNLATNLSGQTNLCLNISNVQSNNAGYYSVMVFNSFGSVESVHALLTVTPVCVDIYLYAGLTLSGGVTGQVYRVQYVTDVNDTSWTTLTTVTQKVSGAFVLDPQPANLQRRFYRVVP